MVLVPEDPFAAGLKVTSSMPSYAFVAATQIPSAIVQIHSGSCSIAAVTARDFQYYRHDLSPYSKFSE
jgi:hypothetical protein